MCASIICLEKVRVEEEVFIGQPVSALPELHTDNETTNFNFASFQADDLLLF